MPSGHDEREQLTALLERSAELRIMAARLEPLAERWATTSSRKSRYATVYPADERDRRRTEAEALEERAQRAHEIVRDARSLAARVEALATEARSSLSEDDISVRAAA
jgi:hypothetical protein